MLVLQQQVTRLQAILGDVLAVVVRGQRHGRQAGHPAAAGFKAWHQATAALRQPLCFGRGQKLHKGQQYQSAAAAGAGVEAGDALHQSLPMRGGGGLLGGGAWA